MAGQLREHQHFLKAGLVQAEFFDAEEFRHLIVGDELQLARRKVVIHRVENQQVIGLLDMLDQVQALSAAIDQRHVVGELITLLQGFDATYAEAFVGPQQVADAQHGDLRQCRLERTHGGFYQCGHFLKVL